MMELVAVAIGVVIGLIIAVAIVRVYFMTRSLNDSFAKLGYVIREDTKKYFDETTGKIIRTNEQLQSSYTEVVHKGTTSALAEASKTLESTLADAQKEAGDIIIKAREDAQRILIEARSESDKKIAEAMNYSSEVIRWSMEQYVRNEYTIDQHRDTIIKLVEEYTGGKRIDTK